MDTKLLHCKSCKQNLPEDAFTKYHRETTHHQGHRCKACVKEYNRQWHINNKKRALDYMESYRKQAKDQAFAAYGGYQCNCCGETEKLFLDLDHINNDGAAHRKQHKLTAGNQVYVWLRNAGYPPGFQVLCSNCNRGKHRNGGICPHKEH